MTLNIHMYKHTSCPKITETHTYIRPLLYNPQDYKKASTQVSNKNLKKYVYMEYKTLHFSSFSSQEKNSGML